MIDDLILTRLLNTFIKIFTLGSAALIPEAMSLLRLLATIEIALLGIWWLYSHDNNMSVLVAKILAFGLLTWLIEHWSSLTRILILSFVHAGLKAGGGGMSETDFTDPSNVAMFGMGVTGMVFQHLKNYAALDALKNIVEILFSGWTAIAIVIAYFVMGLWIFIAQVEFYAIASISVILLPFAIFQKTAFLAEKAISAIFASGIRVLVLSFITSVILPIMDQLKGGLNPRLPDLLLMLLAALALLWLAFRANKLSQSLLYGSPQLTTSDVSGFGASIVRNMSYVTSLAHAVRVRTGAAAPPQGRQPTAPPTGRTP